MKRDDRGEDSVIVTTLLTFSSSASRAVTTLRPRGDGLKSLPAEDSEGVLSMWNGSSAGLCIGLSVSGAAPNGLLMSVSHLQRDHRQLLTPVSMPYCQYWSTKCADLSRMQAHTM